MQLHVFRLFIFYLMLNSQQSNIFSPSTFNIPESQSKNILELFFFFFFTNFLSKEKLKLRIFRDPQLWQQSSSSEAEGG